MEIFYLLVICILSFLFFKGMKINKEIELEQTKKENEEEQQ